MHTPISQKLKDFVYEFLRDHCSDLRKINGVESLGDDPILFEEFRKKAVPGGG